MLHLLKPVGVSVRLDLDPRRANAGSRPAPPSPNAGRSPIKRDNDWSTAISSQFLAFVPCSLLPRLGVLPPRAPRTAVWFVTHTSQFQTMRPRRPKARGTHSQPYRNIHSHHAKSQQSALLSAKGPCAKAATSQCGHMWLICGGDGPTTVTQRGARVRHGRSVKYR